MIRALLENVDLQAILEAGSVERLLTAFLTVDSSTRLNSVLLSTEFTSELMSPTRHQTVVSKENLIYQQLTELLKTIQGPLGDTGATGTPGSRGRTGREGRIGLEGDRGEEGDMVNLTLQLVLLFGSHRSRCFRLALTDFQNEVEKEVC